MTVDDVAIVTLKRQYPHVDQITDFASQQSIKLLWDRVFSLQEQLTAAQVTIRSLITSTNANETAVEAAARQAREALTVTQSPSGSIGGGGSGGGGGSDPGDGGEGDVGCSAAGPDGHDSGGLLTPVRAGQIVCGTGNEYSGLKNATPDLDTRLANAEELLLRCIWHLKEAGFTAGRQQNPSGAISDDKLCVVVNGLLRAYDIFLDVDGYTDPLQMHMGDLGTAVANMQDDDGIPD